LYLYLYNLQELVVYYSIVSSVFCLLSSVLSAKCATFAKNLIYTYPLRACQPSEGVVNISKEVYFELLFYIFIQSKAYQNSLFLIVLYDELLCSSKQIDFKQTIRETEFVIQSVYHLSSTLVLQDL